MIPVAVFFYAAYWAFGIRKALAAPLYRNQALGMGLMSILIGASLIAYGLPLILGLQSNGLGYYLASLLNGFPAFIATFYWIDASILAARRSNPLLRDTLRWSKVRIVYWIVISTSFVLNFLASLYLLETNGVLPYQSASSGIAYYVWVISNFPVILGAPLVGVVIIPIVAFRARDRTLRRHFAWFGLALFFFVLFFVLLGTLVSLGIAPVVTLTGTAYCLYRSAKSLTPLNRISPDMN